MKYGQVWAICNLIDCSRATLIEAEFTTPELSQIMSSSDQHSPTHVPHLSSHHPATAASCQLMCCRQLKSVVCKNVGVPVFTTWWQIQRKQPQLAAWLAQHQRIKEQPCTGLCGHRRQSYIFVSKQDSVSQCLDICWCFGRSSGHKNLAFA